MDLLEARRASISSRTIRSTLRYTIQPSGSHVNPPGRGAADVAGRGPAGGGSAPRRRTGSSRRVRRNRRRHSEHGGARSARLRTGLADPGDILDAVPLEFERTEGVGSSGSTPSFDDRVERSQTRSTAASGGEQMSDSTIVERVTRHRRTDHRRPRARPVRPRAARRHAAGHHRHAARLRGRRQPRHARPRHPADLARARPRRSRCPVTTRSRSPAPASSARCAPRRTSSARSARRSPSASRDIGDGERRVQGVLVAADDTDRHRARRRRRRRATSASSRYDHDRPGQHRVRVGPAAQARRQGHVQATKTPPKNGAAPRSRQPVRDVDGKPIAANVDQKESSMSSLDMTEAIRMLANEKDISVDTLLHVLVDALATRLQAPPRRRRRGRRRGQPGHDGVHLHRLRRRRGRQLGQRARRHAARRRRWAASPPRPSAR